VVEGVPDWRDSIRDMLERLGFRVLMCADGRSALKQSRSIHAEIELLVTDVVMPTMEGTELADAIRIDRPGIAVIYKTAYARDTLAEHGIRPAMLLEKPVEEAALLDALARVLPNAAHRGSRHAS
jgi:CheY-like chemotaxis protein